MPSLSRFRVVLWCSALLALALCRTAFPEPLADAKIVFAARMGLPDYLAPTPDPTLGIPFVRVTTPNGAMGNGVACKRSYCTHRYSSSQAWNADQSLLLIVNGCNALCFLDGHTYAPLFQRQRGGECEWHPQDPELMICVAGYRISRWAPRSNTEDVILDLKAYRELQFGPYKGNPSWDGNRIVVRATNQEGALVAFVVDLSTRQKFPDIALAQLPGTNSYCGISPLGRYIFCQQGLIDLTDQAFVFEIGGNLIQSWTEHHRPGHGDMTVDSDGNEVYVGISKSVPDKYQVIKRRTQGRTGNGASSIRPRPACVNASDTPSRLGVRELCRQPPRAASASTGSAVRSRSHSTEDRWQWRVSTRRPYSECPVRLLERNARLTLSGWVASHLVEQLGAARRTGVRFCFPARLGRSGQPGRISRGRTS